MMTAGGPQERLEWQTARVRELRGDAEGQEHRARRARLARPSRGQHVDVRLTARTAIRHSAATRSPPHPRIRRSRSPSSASPTRGLAVPVRRARPGDELELRGPIGATSLAAPASSRVLLVAGGSASSRSARCSAPPRERLAGRGPPDLLGALARRRHLPLRARAARADGALDLSLVLTREWPEAGRTARAHRPLGARRARLAAAASPLVYACGRSGFVETAANELVALGHEAALIRTERFGPTGRRIARLQRQRGVRHRDRSSTYCRSPRSPRTGEPAPRPAGHELPAASPGTGQPVGQTTWPRSSHSISSVQEVSPSLRSRSPRVREIYKLWRPRRCTARAASRRRSTRRHIYYKYEGSPRPARTSPTAPSRRPTTTARPAFASS